MNTKVKPPFAKMPTSTAVFGAVALGVVGYSLMRTKLGSLITLLAGGYLVYRIFNANKSNAPFRFKHPLPPGAKPTGRIKDTYTGGKPGQEIVGFGLKHWAEIILPSGQVDWVEVLVEERKRLPE